MMPKVLVFKVPRRHVCNKILREAKPGGFPNPGGVPHFFRGKVQIVSRTLLGLFLVGALNRPRKRKGTNRENPRTIPEQIGKIPEKSGKSQKGQKIRNPEKGGVREGGVAQICRSCAPNLREIADILFRASEEGCAKLSQICRKFEGKFRTILCKYPFSKAPFSKLLKIGPKNSGQVQIGKPPPLKPPRLAALENGSDFKSQRFEIAQPYLGGGQTCNN